MRSGPTISWRIWSDLIMLWWLHTIFYGEKKIRGKLDFPKYDSVLLASHNRVWSSLMWSDRICSSCCCTLSIQGFAKHPASSKHFVVKRVSALSIWSDMFQIRSDHKMPDKVRSNHRVWSDLIWSCCCGFTHLLYGFTQDPHYFQVGCLPTCECWSHLNWSDLVWSGLIWFIVIWPDLIRSNQISDMMGPDMIWLNIIWTHLIGSDRVVGSRLFFIVSKYHLPQTPSSVSPNTWVHFFSGLILYDVIWSETLGSNVISTDLNWSDLIMLSWLHTFFNGLKTNSPQNSFSPHTMVRFASHVIGSDLWGRYVPCGCVRSVWVMPETFIRC